jgi:hypothetical protein
MFRQSHARRTAADVADIERRILALEKRIGRTAGRTSSNISSGVSQATERAGEVIAAALNEVGNRFRGGARSVSAEANHFGQEAARLGNNALRRLSDEVEHRPLMLLAIAAGVGFLAGIAGRRH